MFENVEDYLKQLRKDLRGSDPATVQDALSDAEEHLRTALEQARREAPDVSEKDALEPILVAYGTPADVAAAYREIEDRTHPALAPAVRPAAPTTETTAAASRPGEDRSLASRFFGVFVDPRAYAALFYMFFSLITGILYFTWAVTGLSLSLGLIVLVIGVPFIIVFLLSVQGIALVEGRMVEALLGVRMPRRPLFAGRHLGYWDRLKTLFTDKVTWTTLVYLLLQLPLGILYFTVFITMLAFGVAGILYPFAYGLFDVPLIQVDHRLFYPPVWLLPLIVLVGVLWILVTMHAGKWVGRLHGSYAKLLLVRD